MLCSRLPGLASFIALVLLGCAPDFAEAVSLSGADDSTSDSASSTGAPATGPAPTGGPDDGSTSSAATPTSGDTSSGDVISGGDASSGSPSSSGAGPGTGETTSDATSITSDATSTTSDATSTTSDATSTTGDATSTTGDATSTTGDATSTTGEASDSRGNTCGDETIETPELCDGSNLGGRTCETQGFAGGTLSCAVDCTAFDTTECGAHMCGDGNHTGDEACDGDDLGGANCVSLGYGGGTLACGSDCTHDVTQCLRVSAETEPNDDGSVAVGTSDFSAAAADGPLTSSALIAAAIAPAGDDDVLAVTNAGASYMLLEVETFGAGGVGTCAGGVDTLVEIRTDLNQLLASDDNSGIASCSLVTGVPIGPGETRYVRVIEEGDDAAIANYFVATSFTPVACGDGIAGPGEQCDDGAHVNDDGCSSTCQVEGAVAEIEPNATNSEADGAGILISDDAILAGALATVGDVDRFRLDVAIDGVLRLETFTSVGACDATLALRVYDDLGGEVTGDTAASGIGGCGALVVPLPVGTYYLGVEEIGQDAFVPTYLVEIAYLIDNGTEAEPNDIFVQADLNISGGSSDAYVFGDHSDNADSDVYEVGVPTDGLSLRLELVEGDASTETCESSGIESRLTLYDAAGIQLLDDDDSGRGACSRIDGTGPNPADPAAHGLAAGTYYVEVRESASASVDGGQFNYRLAVTLR